MKKLLIAFFTIFSLSLGGCLKDTPNVDFSNIVPHAEFMYPGGANGNGLGSGMEFFGGAAWTFPPLDANGDPYDTTIYFLVNIAAPNPPTTATTVTVAVDPSITAAYNADSNNEVKFENMPDSVYKILNNSVTIKAGKYEDTIWMTISPSKIDPTKSYMAPVKLADAGGTAISTNFSVIFFHTIGNPIAGAYNWDYTRWNQPTMTGPTSGFVGGGTLFLPDNPTQVEVSTGYGYTVGFSLRYVITFDYTGGVVSNVAMELNPTDVANMAANNGITVTTPPSIILADPATGQYKFTFGVYNGTANRTFIDYFYK
ncbi:MAG: DUF1735 domain-containing protein [Chitinophagales bacterium]